MKGTGEKDIGTLCTKSVEPVTSSRSCTKAIVVSSPLNGSIATSIQSLARLYLHKVSIRPIR